MLGLQITARYACGGIAFMWRGGAERIVAENIKRDFLKENPDGKCEITPYFIERKEKPYNYPRWFHFPLRKDDNPFGGKL